MRWNYVQAPCEYRGGHLTPIFGIGIKLNNKLTKIKGGGLVLLPKEIGKKKNQRGKFQGLRSYT